MNTCKTCKKWNRDYRNASVEGECLSTKRTISYIDFKVPNDGFAFFPRDDNNKEFYTGPDFGCVNHEPK